jgi:hypothetical protein
VINPENSSAYLRTIEIIYSQNGRFLVFISQKGKALWFPCNFVASEAQVDYLAELREDYGDVPLIHGVVQTSNEDVGAVVLS